MSYIITTRKLKAEARKIFLEYQHEDKKIIASAFAEMISKTGALSNDRSISSINSALDSCAAFISVSPEKYHSILIELDKAIRDYDIEKIENARISLIQIKSDKI